MTKGFHSKYKCCRLRVVADCGCLFARRLEKQSKRVTCKKRYKIEKKVREHNRKVRKQAKKNGSKKAKRKDPGVPANLPFKDEVIREAQAANEREKERKQLLREEMKRRNQQGREKKVAEKRGIDLAALASDAAQRGQQFDEKHAAAAGNNNQLPGVSNLSAYYKEFQKVV